MELSHIYENYTTVGDILSAVSCIAILMVVHWVLYFAKDEKFGLLKDAVHFILFGAIFNILFYLYVTKGSGSASIVYLLRLVYHACFMVTIYLFSLYVRSMMNVDNKTVKRIFQFTQFLLTATLLIEAFSPLTGFGLHQEGSLWYDSIYNAYNIFYLYSMLLMFVLLVVYSNRLIRTVRLVLIATEILMSAVMVYGAFSNTNTFTSFTYVLPIFVVMIMLHSKPFNDKTGALSEEGLDSYIKETLGKVYSMDYMVLQLKLGNASGLPEELGKVLNSFWHSYFKDAILFNTHSDMYVLAIPRIEKNGDTAKKINAVIQEKFFKYYAKFQLQYKVIGLIDINFIQNASELKHIINYMLLTMDDNTMVIVDDDKRAELRAIKNVEENLADIDEKADLEDPRVLAYCQPIRNMKTGKFDTAEALMRLTLPGQKYVTPNVFIPLAESYGYIHTLTKIMLNKVCREIKKLEEEGFFFRRISVNFAASEIKNENFCDEVLNIIKSNDVDPSKIGVELTETQNESDFKIVSEKIATLRQQGMTFYLDDIGTGYSNLDRIVKYDVDVVKFDRFFLVEAEKDEKIVQLIRHLSEAFRNLGYKLLYEGVENDDNNNLCVKCGADYIQGFMYAKPVPVEEMRSYFEKK